MENLEIYYVKDSYGDNGVVVKLPRPVELKGATGVSYMIEPIYVLGFADSANKVYIITSEEFNTPNFSHYNLDEYNGYKKMLTLTKKSGNFEKGTTFNITGRHFCNPVTQSELYFNPELYAHMIAMQLEEPNPSNAYGSSSRAVENYISPLKKDKVIKCSCCGRVLKNNNNPLGLIVRCCDNCFSNALENNTIINGLSSINNTGYYAKSIKSSNYRHLKRKPKKIENYSEYYNLIDCTTLGNIEDVIPKKEIDLLLLGCGSAGTSIVEQLARTQMIQSYKLIDFDKVESKNLRNQIYTKYDIGRDKVVSLRDIISKYNTNNLQIEVNNTKYQAVNMRYYNFKYTVLAFDSINTRIEAFYDIKNGKITTQYIVDTRYDDLECSIYFVDVTNDEQMNYYEQSLLADKMELDKIKAKKLEELNKIDSIKPKFTYSRLTEYWNTTDGFTCNCISNLKSFGINRPTCLFQCGSEQCKMFLYNLLKDKQAPDSVKHIPLDEKDLDTLLNDNTCYHYNIIDVYKFASSFITSTIRNIYNNKPKEFTHIEVSTSGLPKSLVIMN